MPIRITVPGCHVAADCGVSRGDNGCSYCTDMHTKDAARAGETQVRLNLVATWREATVFTEAERAALELAEQGTRQSAGDYRPGQWG